MKKFWLATVGLLALGMAAPASAADLAARPYTKAPPAPVAVIYDWTGFYIGINGGGGSARKCGAGLEYGFAPSWSVGVEYDHVFMGSRNVTLTAPLFSETEHIRQDVDMGLVRLNYRFGGFGGFGARY
jgi:opacity protein-like surface antigen